jgi:tetratricopeptide (TPR) repeat protein
LNPAFVVAHKNLGLVLRDTKQYQEAESAFREAVRLAVPGYAAAENTLNMLSALKLQIGASKPYEEAEAAVREAIRLCPTYAAARNYLGLLHRKAGRLKEAEAAFTEAIRLNPGLATAHNNLGLVLRDTKRYEEAAAAFREAIRLERPPLDTGAKQNLEDLLRSREYRRRRKK